MNTIVQSSDATSGICRMQCFSLPHIDAIIRENDGTGKVYLKNDCHAFDIPVIDEERFRYQETSSMEEGGRVYNSVVEGVIQTSGFCNDVTKEVLSLRDYIVIVEQTDGTVRCFGSKEFPMRFSTDRDSNLPYEKFQMVGCSVWPSFIVTNDIL